MRACVWEVGSGVSRYVEKRGNGDDGQQPAAPPPGEEKKNCWRRKKKKNARKIGTREKRKRPSSSSRSGPRISRGTAAVVGGSRVSAARSCTLGRRSRDVKGLTRGARTHRCRRSPGELDMDTLHTRRIRASIYYIYKAFCAPFLVSCHMDIIRVYTPI